MDTRRREEARQELSLTKPILILGGYGVFGGKLARRLAKAGADVIVAGRSLEKASAFCAQHGGRPLALDRDGDLTAALTSLRPAIVVDAAGPFQAYEGDFYRVPRAAIACGAHYIDLADDAAFVTGVRALDIEAQAASVVVRSGASSVPAISAAALDELTTDMTEVAVVGSIILPGNRAPRGLSVIRAIVSQVGHPLAFWRGNAWQTQPAWGDLQRVAPTVEGVPPLPPRLASCIDAPDRLLFPSRYRARSVLFHAGLELRLMHVGLCLLGWLVRSRLMRSLASLAPALKWTAERLEPFGTDRGGMTCYALGRDSDGRAVERRWTLIAEGGDGPEIPPTPALLLALKLLEGGKLEAGAGPAIGDLSLDGIETELRLMRIVTAITEQPAPVLLERILPDEFASLPAAWQRLADVHDVERFEGMASVERGSSLLSRLAGWLMRFPPAVAQTSVIVTKRKTTSGETWERDFGGRRFRSHLSQGSEPGELQERFGPFRFRIRLISKDGRVLWPVEGWSLLGLPMPPSLGPRSDSVEFVDADGLFHFDVAISMPLAGPVVHYRGWLKPVENRDGRPQ